jgi:hypothetical protein
MSGSVTLPPWLVHILLWHFLIISLLLNCKFVVFRTYGSMSFVKFNPKYFIFCNAIINERYSQIHFELFTASIQCHSYPSYTHTNSVTSTCSCIVLVPWKLAAELNTVTTQVASLHGLEVWLIISSQGPLSHLLLFLVVHCSRWLFLMNFLFGRVGKSGCIYTVMLKDEIHYGFRKTFPLAAV